MSVKFKAVLRGEPGVTGGGTKSTMQALFILARQALEI